MAYGSTARVVVAPTSDREAVRRAIDSLVPSGSTHAEDGLVLAYDVAREYGREGAVHKVILCSDGVANRGRTSHETILKRIEVEARAHPASASRQRKCRTQRIEGLPMLAKASNA